MNNNLKISKNDLNKLIEIEKSSKYYNDNKDKFGSDISKWINIDDEIYHGDYVGLYLNDMCIELGYDSLSFDELLDIRDAVVEGIVSELN